MIVVVEVFNWEDYNGRKDLKSMPWLRVEKDLPFSKNLFGLTAEQKWAFVCLITECARQFSGTVRLDTEWCEHFWGVSEDALMVLLERLEKLKKVGVTFEKSENPNESDRIRTDPDESVTNERTNERNERTNETDAATADPVGLIQDLVLFWNSKTLPTAKLSNHNKALLSTLVESHLKNYDYKQIKTAIDNYKTVLDNPDSWWTHQWTLEEFLKTQKGGRFFPDKFSHQSYISSKKASKSGNDEIETAVGEIMQAIPNYGPGDYEAAKQAVGPLAAKIISEITWGQIVRTTNFELPALRAKLVMVGKSQLIAPGSEVTAC